MSVALVSTWQPRGELSRFQRLHPLLTRLFSTIVLAMPPDAEDIAGMVRQMPNVRASTDGEWRMGRHTALRLGLETDATHLLYSDFDRALRWVELHPDELAMTLKRLDNCECLVIGRTERAFATHPRCLRETEQVINEVFAHVTGLPFDICVAARGLSRSAAARILTDSRVESSLGVDGEWLYLLHRAGYPLDYTQVEGMDWETVDQYLPAAADSETQRRAAEEYDKSPQHWSQRVFVMQHIIRALLAADGGTK
ncbi:MAG: hypothetical protein SF123_19910 [Chloroflexota bacterium]|nr:hypothetical protein [Chloroflexota bacterium]